MVGKGPEASGRYIHEKYPETSAHSKKHKSLARGSVVRARMV